MATSKIGTWSKEGDYHVWTLRTGGRNGPRIVLKRKEFPALKTAVTAKLAELHDTGSIVQVSTDPTVKQKLTRWLEDRVKPYRAEKTYRSYKQTCETHIFPVIGSVKVSKLTSAHGQKVVATALAKGLSNRTATYAATVLFIGIGKRKSMELKEEIELPPPTPPRDRALEREEIVAVLDECFKQRELKTRPGEFVYLYRDRHLIAFLLNSGLRISEALGLLILRVNLLAAEVQIVEQLAVGKRKDKNDKTERVKWNLKDLKTTASRRIVPLNDYAVHMLRLQLAMIEEDKARAGKGYDDKGLLFATESGRPTSSRNVLRTLDRILKSAGVEYATVHDLRRSYLTHLAAVEEHMQHVSAIAGHASIQTTMRVYVKAKELGKRKAALKVNFAMPAAPLPQVKEAGK